MLTFKTGKPDFVKGDFLIVGNRGDYHVAIIADDSGFCFDESGGEGKVGFFVSDTLWLDFEEVDCWAILPETSSLLKDWIKA